MIKILRIILAIIYLIFASIIGLVFCLFRPFAPENTLFLGRLLGFGMLPLLGIKLSMSGLENFEEVTGPAIVLSNHQDNMDLFIVGSFVPYKTVSLGKKVIRLFPFIGQIYWLSGQILIDRKRKKRAVSAMNQAGEKMMKEGIKVWIMPEGTRSKGRGLLPFKSGAFHLAQQTKLPIINVCFSNYAQNWRLNEFKRHQVYGQVQKPLFFPEDNYPSPEELKNICYEKIKEGIAEMDKKAGYSVS